MSTSWKIVTRVRRVASSVKGFTNRSTTPHSPISKSRQLAKNAALACPDLPTCQGEWWPEADFGEGFVLWRGIGIDYEGGVLDGPARAAIHLTHRIGAIVVTLVLVALGAALLIRGGPRLKVAGGAVLAALALQIAIGVGIIEWSLPLWLATAHNAGGALLLLALLFLNYESRHARG